VNLVSGLGMILGGSWASGINLYLTMFVLGVAGRLGLINLPGGLEVLMHPAIKLLWRTLLPLIFFSLFTRKISEYFLEEPEHHP